MSSPSSTVSTPTESIDELMDEKRKSKPTKMPSDILKKRREVRAKAAADLQNKLNEIGIRRVDNENDMAFTNIPAIQLINQKNYYTDYLKKDDQFRFARKMRAVKSKQPEEDDDEVVDEKSQTIVLHPGSSTIRVGLASDVDPHLVPNLIAYKTASAHSYEVDPKREFVNGEVVINDPGFSKMRKTVSNNFKERMKYYKRRILPNSQDTCANFNKRQQPEIIPEHNDVHGVTYINPDMPYVIGEDVMKLKNEDQWLVRSPFDSGKFHDVKSVYSSVEEVLSDVENLLRAIFRDIMQLDLKKMSNYNCVLIIPNLFDKNYVEAMCQILLNKLNIGNISTLQEGISATFGSGISNGCIVDIGASTTKICCVDEGMILPNSQIELSYGGNDITRVLIKMLLGNQFPYREIDLNNLSDWRLANELKEKYSTFQDADVAVQMYGFISRKPGAPIRKYEYKLFEELMIPAMGLFYPEFFKHDSNQRKVLGKKSGMEPRLFPKHWDYVSGELDNPTSKLQQLEQLGKQLALMDDESVLKTLKMLEDENSVVSEDPLDEVLNYTPLDLAIIESITAASFNDKGRMKRLYESILLVGGSSMFNGIELILIDRIHIWRSKLLSSGLLDDIVKLYEAEVTPAIINMINNSTSVPIEILSSSKEVDPSAMIWKGGSVYSRLKIISELWINQQDWDILGSRCLNQTCLFNY